MGSSNKVKVFDEHRDNFLFENAALRSKLQSKVEALTILGNELDKCRSERDQLKLLTDQLRDRRRGSFVRTDADKKEYSPQMSGGNVARLLEDTRDTNRGLQLEVESLRQKVRESAEEVGALRRQLNHRRVSHNVFAEAQLFPVHQREELVAELEKCNVKVTQLRADLQSVLDEKEELVKERDAFKCKSHRLSHELGVLLGAERGAPLLRDGDALISENRYLHERLEQAESETRLVTQALVKYKEALCGRRGGGGGAGSSSSRQDSADLVMSHGQVSRLLNEGGGKTMTDMRPLCLGLLEALNDKSVALAHQRRANKILAARLFDLEQLLEKQRGVPVYPSRALLSDYCSASVDGSSCEPEQPEGPEIELDERETLTIIKSSQSPAAADDGAAVLAEDQQLPPQLQRLVDQALRDLEQQQ